MPEADRTKPRVLLVEDDDGVRQSEIRLLTEEGFLPTGVATGEEAMQLIERDNFDLVLMDLDLKEDPDGLEICRRIKAKPHLAWIPIMFVTGHVSADAVSKVFTAGGDEFVAKPFKPEELIVRARVLVRKGREERWLVERARKLAEKVAERDDELDDLRRFAQDIVGSLPSALMVIDSEATVLFANQPLLTWLAAERREVIGRKLEDFARPEGMDGPVGKAIYNAIRTGKPVRLRRVPGFLKGRENFMSDLSVAPIEYAGVRQVLVVIEDVTEQARAEAAVARERSKLTDIVNAMNAALCLIDRNRTILWKNRTFDLWFGDHFGQPGLSAFMDKLPKSDGWLDTVFGEGQIAHVTWSIFTTHGQRRHFTNIVAPIKEEHDEVTQALVLTQDVTEQETRVEQLSLLRELSNFLQQTLDIDRLHHVILLCVTAGHALGFNRAFLFKRDRDSNLLEAQMAVGPESREEAFRIWAELSSQSRTLNDLVTELDAGTTRIQTGLYHRIRDLAFSLDDPREIVVRTALEKKAQVVTHSESDGRVSAEFRRRFNANEFVSVPMVSKGSVVGVILADNLYSGRAITDDHVKLLTLFASQAALAIENAETYAELQKRMVELRSAQERVVHSEKLAAVGKMAAHVAHEIRNPLTTIGGFARAILKRPDSVERVERNAKIITEETMRLETMLKDVMDFSRPSPPHLEPSDLNAIVEKACATQAESLESAGIRLNLQLDRSLPDVRMDENQFLQILHNLIRNARDSMTKGGELTLRTRRTDEEVVLVVSDTGCGIAPEVKERMFSPFVTTKPDGTGLGLAVSKKIVDDHGGQIDCESEIGRGTSFSIRLPVHRGSPAPLSRPEAAS